MPLKPKIPYPACMPQALFTRNLIHLALLPLMLCACGTPEVLLPKSAAVPPGIDFSGQWKMRPESKRGQPHVNEAINRTDGVDNQTFVNAIAHSFRLPAIEKQALLEANSVRERLEQLGGLLQFRLVEGGGQGPSDAGSVH